MIIGDIGFVNTKNIAELTEVSLSLNPASEIISIDYNFQGEGNFNISVYDNSGKEVI